MELFNLFSPRARRWAINGAAGMGKSVLLAYTLFVFASDRRVTISDPDQLDSRTLEDFAARAAEIGLPPIPDRVIYAMARKDKQLDALRYYWDLFVERYSRLSDRLGLQIQQPIFQKWSGDIPEDCNVLLIDESHDLDPADQGLIASLLNAEETTRYLAIACDRHQKLRLVGTDAVLIEGLNFTNQTVKLRRNYRNPFPVYVAGLALMFRWLASSGPKVIPTGYQLKEEFGFNVAPEERVAGRITLQSWNDSHPGNYWSFTTSTFFSCQDAYSQLGDGSLTNRDVL
jgi:hypothetical protein